MATLLPTSNWLKVLRAACTCAFSGPLHSAATASRLAPEVKRHAHATAGVEDDAKQVFLYGAF